MANHSTPGDARVAVLVDCDNISPEVLEHALRVGAQFGRIVLIRCWRSRPSALEADNA